MKDRLTEAQSVAYEMREDGATFTVIAESLGCSRGTAHTHYAAAVTKLKGGAVYEPPDQRIVSAAAAAKAQVAALESDIPANLKKWGKAADLSPAIINSLIKRATPRSMGGGVEGQELAALSNQNMIALSEDRIAKLFSYLDDAAMASATVSSLSVAIGILVDKRQILKGEPTSILGIEDRRQLNELGEALLGEMKRRRMIDITPGVVNG